MEDKQNQLVVRQENTPVSQKEGLFFNPAAFEHAQRVAQVFTKSTMVPEIFRNNIGNCLIALNYAARMEIDPFMVMQKMYVIKGKPAVETQLQIALFNAAGKFTPIRYNLTGKGEDRQCVAIATEKATGEEIEGPVVSLKMAKAEGWGMKWKTLPELMLRYRSAAFFIRLYSPETTLGIATREEAEDIQEVSEPVQNGEFLDVEPETTPEPEPEKKAEPKKTVPVTKPTTDDPY